MGNCTSRCSHLRRWAELVRPNFARQTSDRVAVCRAPIQLRSCNHISDRRLRSSASFKKRQPQTLDSKSVSLMLSFAASSVHLPLHCSLPVPSKVEEQL